MLPGFSHSCSMLASTLSARNEHQRPCQGQCREAYFLKKLQHPNIVRCDEVVDDGHQMVLVMEYLRGGQLFDQLEQLTGEHYSEKTAAQLFKQVQAPLLLRHCC